MATRKWLTPAQRYDEIDAAVASWSPSSNSVGSLGGVIPRLAAWGMLAAQVSSLDMARSVAQASNADVAGGLQEVRALLQLACVESEDLACGELGF